MTYQQSRTLKRRKKYNSSDVLITSILTILVLLIFFPFYNAIVISFETSRAYALFPVSLYPMEFSLKNYAYLLDNGQILVGYKNSIFITTIGTAYGMIVSVMTAYAFSRPSFPGKKLLFAMMMFTMLFSGGMVPTYLQLKALGLVNSRFSVILLIGVSTYNIIIIKSGFEQTPPSLSEAAKIDGANELTIFLRIMLPLQSALLATFTLFTAVMYWNEWFWSMLMINSADKMTLQTVLRSIVAEAAADADIASGEAGLDAFSQGIKMAAVTMTLAPIMCLYPFLQKYFVKGVMVGSVKM